MSEALNIKRCPVCGRRATLHTTNNGQAMRYRAGCDVCEVWSSECESSEEALAAFGRFYGRWGKLAEDRARSLKRIQTCGWVAIVLINILWSMVIVTGYLI